MKVLVVNLLRLGDFVQTLPVLHALRSQLGIESLDLLTHHPVKQLAPMVPGIGHWWTLQRDDLQEGLGRGEIPLLTSLSVLQEQLDAINANEYDYVINLSQTKYAAWISGYLHAEQRAGLHYDRKGQAHFHSPWFQYLDDQADVSAADIFHLTDIFYYGCGLKEGERHWSLLETPRGQNEVEVLGLPANEKIVCQILTSDSKKTWPSMFWLSMFQQIQVLRPQAQIILLGSPSESEILQKLARSSRGRGIQVKTAILSLEGAFSLLKSAQILITGDTSIKHIANALVLPVLELSLGPSDYRRTGIFKSDSLILQSLVSCAPCPHSKPCHQPAQICAEMIKPSAVAVAALHLLNRDWSALKILAAQLQDSMRFLRTRFTSGGFWMASDLRGTESEKHLETLIQRATYLFLFNRSHLEPVAAFGTLGVQVKRELQAVLSPEQIAPLLEHLTILESRADLIAEKAAHQLSGVRGRVPRPVNGQVGVVDIGGWRRAQSHLEKVQQQANIEVKLIRALQFHLAEGI